MNIDKYIKNSFKVYLKEITFENNPFLDDSDSHLECHDEIKAEFKEEDTIDLTFIRHVTFSPQKSWDLKIVMGAELMINLKKAKDVQWKEINLAKELKASTIIDGLISKASLLISQISSTAAPNPIITPPSFIEEED